jgi:hypothetical protein
MKVRLPPVYEKPRHGDIRDSVSAITAAKKAFGYQTRYSLDEGLAETVQWFRLQKKRKSSKYYGRFFSIQGVLNLSSPVKKRRLIVAPTHKCCY